MFSPIRPPASSAHASSVSVLPESTVAAGEIHVGDRLIVCAPEEMKRHLQSMKDAKAEAPAPRGGLARPAHRGIAGNKMNRGTDFGDGHGFDFSSKFWTGQRTAFSGLVLESGALRAAALATAAAGFFAGTAPHEKHHRDQHNDQRKKLLPIHAANIPAKTNRATGIFRLLTRLGIAIALAKNSRRSSRAKSPRIFGVELLGGAFTLRAWLNCSVTRIASLMPNAPSATTSIIRAISICSKPRAANSCARSVSRF